MGTVPRAPADPFRLVGTTLAGKYRIDAPVAAGGFGVVYVAHHLALDVRIAVKVLSVPEELGERARAAFIDKFFAEARIIARLRHPAIVKVLDTGASATPAGAYAPWIAMEWLAGQTLKAFLAARRAGLRAPRAAGPATAAELRPLGPATAFALMRPVLAAIAAAHEQGVAHRDLKPANIMLVPGPGSVEPCVLDFGIAKVMQPEERAGSEETSARHGMTAFSPGYAAPEQVVHARTGPWTDVHALGLILSQLLTDRSPYDTRDQTDLYRQVLAPDRPTPARFGVDAGPWEPVLARALAVRPEQRFANAGEMLAALAGALDAAALAAGAASAVAAVAEALAIGAASVRPDASGSVSAAPPLLRAPSSTHAPGLAEPSGAIAAPTVTVTPLAADELGRAGHSANTTLSSSVKVLPGEGRGGVDVGGAPRRVASTRVLVSALAVVGVAAFGVGVGLSRHATGPAATASSGATTHDAAGAPPVAAPAPPATAVVSQAPPAVPPTTAAATGGTPAALAADARGARASRSPRRPHHGASRPHHGASRPQPGGGAATEFTPE